MDDENLHFAKNLKYLHKIHPALAYQITYTDPVDLRFCKTHAGELNLVRSYENRIYHYHSTINARHEAQEWFQSLDLHQATVIFVYGIGLGYYYEAAKMWLKKNPHRRLVFLEQDPGVLHRLCATELGHDLLKNPQVQLFLFQDFLSDKALINELSWSYFESSSTISCLKLYEEANHEGFIQLRHQLLYEFELKRDFVHEYLNFGIHFFRNFYPNLLELPHAHSGNALFNHFSQVPAIICGAGPSLNKHLESLSSLKNRALLLAGGSALNAMIPKGIIPHFGAAIDPNIEQYRRVAIAQPFRIPFFYRNRLFHEALTAITGPRLYLTGAGGYETARFFEDRLKIEGEDLEEGHNVVNFSIQIAHALGCNPIILVGVDLAFTNQRFYADGISDNLNLDENELLKPAALGEDHVLKEDIYGKPIYTFWKWVAEAKWISDFAEHHPETTFINSTEGGLGFKGIPNVPLQEAIGKYLTEPKQAIESIDKTILEHSFKKISKNKIIKLLREFKESLKNCILLISKLESETDRLIEAVRKKKTCPAELSPPAMIILEGELEEQVAYQYLLEMFNQVFIRIHHREIQELQSPKRKIAKKNRAEKQLLLRKQRLNFLRDVAQVNRDLIFHTLAR